MIARIVQPGTGTGTEDGNSETAVIHTRVVTIVNLGGQIGFDGDGGSAQLAKIRSPEALKIDNYQNLLFIDFFNQRVRRVEMLTDPATGERYPGTITTVVGSGIRGSGCPGYPPGAQALPTTWCHPLQAMLRFPRALAVDSYNNIYLLDGGNNVIRRVSGYDHSSGTWGNFTNFLGSGKKQDIASLVSGSVGASNFNGNLLPGQWVQRNSEVGLAGSYEIAMSADDTLWVLILFSLCFLLPVLLFLKC